MALPRILVLWLPDWPEQHHDPAADSRAFAPIFARLTEIVPEVEIIRPGLVALRARGPARYYGSEADAARTLLEFAHSEGFPEARIGAADGRFAAQQAAFCDEPAPEFADAPHPHIRLVREGMSVAFLSRLPIHCCADDDLATLLTGLGMYTLGAFAAIPEDAVRARFGPPGVRAHRHARGEDADPHDSIRPDIPARELGSGLDFEPPLAGAEQLAFACSTLADRLVSALTAEQLVCTTLRVSLTDDIGVRHERDWSHPRFFSATDIVARVRWQAEQLTPERFAHAENTGAGIASVHIAPIRTDRTAAHEPGLWNTGPDSRVHHHLSRAQGLLGPTGAGTATLEGGRLLSERQRFTPWGDAPQRDRAAGPWPGALPAPHPSLVFPTPLRARLLTRDGGTVRIDDDDLLADTPSLLRVEGVSVRGAVHGWSAPWPIRERWWDHRPERFRLQLELDDGDAWLLLAHRHATAARSPHQAVSWYAEGRYD